MPRSKVVIPTHNGARAPLHWAERLPTSRTLARFLAQAQNEVGLRGQVAVLLTTDAAIRDLNLRFRGHAKSTDVLSFPTAETAGNKERIAGDLAISVETARRQSTACGHSLGVELKVLILHGLLHLAGYDHEKDTGRMDRRERVLRKRLRLPVALIERAGSGSASRQVSNSARRAASPILSQKAQKDGAKCKSAGQRADKSRRSNNS